jgi:hypothetical protein
MKFKGKSRFVCITAMLVAFFSDSAFAAETLTDSIKNGKTDGEVKIWYQTNDSEANKNIFESENSWFDAGLSLAYVTNAYKGFKAGVNFYAVDDLGAYENWADRSMMGVDHSDTEAWLGEAYISYDIWKTMAKFGRQNISSPLLNSDKWAIFPNNFEAFTIKNNDLPSTTLVGGYVWEERWLQSQDFEDFYEGVFMLGAVNQSFSNTTLTAYLYFVNDDVTNYITESPAWDTTAAYFESMIKLSPFDLGLQYIRMDPDRKGSDETDAAAAMISAKIADVKVSVAYSYVSDGTLLAAKISDHRMKTSIYTATIAGDGDIAGRPDTESIKVSVEISPIDKLNLIATYAYYDMDDSKYYADISDDGCSQTELVCKYTGIENVTLWGAVWYSDHEGIGAYNGLNNAPLTTFRFWTSYKF